MRFYFAASLSFSFPLRTFYHCHCHITVVLFSTITYTKAPFYYGATHLILLFACRLFFVFLSILCPRISSMSENTCILFHSHFDFHFMTFPNKLHNAYVEIDTKWEYTRFNHSSRRQAHYVAQFMRIVHNSRDTATHDNTQKEKNQTKLRNVSMIAYLQMVAMAKLRLVNTQAQNKPFFAYFICTFYIASFVFLRVAVVACIWRWYDSSTRNTVRWMWQCERVTLMPSHLKTLCTIIVLYIIITYGVCFSSCHRRCYWRCCCCFLPHFLCFSSRRVAPGAFWRWSRYCFFVWSCCASLLDLAHVQKYSS